MKMLSEEKIKIVNGNIPLAVQAADVYVESDPSGNKFVDDRNWNLVYYKTMDDLCVEDGVRVVKNKHLEKMMGCVANEDYERAHGDADNILCEVLRGHGHVRLVEEYEKVKKFCA